MLLRIARVFCVVALLPGSPNFSYASSSSGPSTIDVTLPNGVIVYQIPKDASKLDVARIAIDRGLATEEDFTSWGTEVPRRNAAESLLQAIKSQNPFLEQSYANFGECLDDYYLSSPPVQMTIEATCTFLFKNKASRIMQTEPDAKQLFLCIRKRATAIDWKKTARCSFLV